MFPRCAFVIGLTLSLVAPALAADGLVNASFDQGTEGWDVSVGASAGRPGAESTLARDETVKRAGPASLRCAGDGQTTTWRMVTQSVDLDPSGDPLVSLRVAARCEGVVREGTQYANANGLVIFENREGKRTGFFATAVMQGDREWVELGIDVVAPIGSVRATVGVFHSMSGTTWFDDVRLTVTPTTPFDAAARGAALTALEGHLRRSYPFWGLGEKPDDPTALFARHREACVGAADQAHFVGALRGLLTELDDVHVSVSSPLGTIGTAQPFDPGPFPIQAVLGRLTEKVVHGSNVLAGWIGEGDERIGYLLVGSFGLAGEDARLFEEALEKLAAAPSLIIDVRPNGGGDERQAMRIASRFTAESVVYAHNVYRDPTLRGVDGFFPGVDRVLAPAPDEARFAGKAVVLAGPGCVSSTEGFLLMCKALPKITIVGLPSRGASANPADIRLTRTLAVRASRWRSLDLEGECIEGRGVIPDVRVEPVGVTRQGQKDPALDRAVELLRE
jgi:hypothetical protein